MSTAGKVTQRRRRPYKRKPSHVEPPAAPNPVPQAVPGAGPATAAAAIGPEALMAELLGIAAGAKRATAAIEAATSTEELAKAKADNRGLVGDAQLGTAALLALQLEYQQGASEAVNREVTGAFRATAAAVAAVKGGRGDGCFVSFPADAVPGGVARKYRPKDGRKDAVDLPTLDRLMEAIWGHLNSNDARTARGKESVAETIAATKDGRKRRMGSHARLGTAGEVKFQDNAVRVILAAFGANTIDVNGVPVELNATSFLELMRVARSVGQLVLVPDGPGGQGGLVYAPELSCYFGAVFANAVHHSTWSGMVKAISDQDVANCCDTVVALLTAAATGANLVLELTGLVATAAQLAKPGLHLQTEADFAVTPAFLAGGGDLFCVPAIAKVLRTLMAASVHLPPTLQYAHSYFRAFASADHSAGRATPTFYSLNVTVRLGEADPGRADHSATAQKLAASLESTEAAYQQMCQQMKIEAYHAMPAAEKEALNETRKEAYHAMPAAEKEALLETAKASAKEAYHAMPAQKKTALLAKKSAQKKEAYHAMSAEKKTALGAKNNAHQKKWTFKQKFKDDGKRVKFETCMGLLLPPGWTAKLEWNGNDWRADCQLSGEPKLQTAVPVPDPADVSKMTWCDPVNKPGMDHLYQLKALAMIYGIVPPAGNGMAGAFEWTNCITAHCAAHAAAPV